LNDPSWSPNLVNSTPAVPRADDFVKSGALRTKKETHCGDRV
jgi:hypothetical protein